MIYSKLDVFSALKLAIISNIIYKVIEDKGSEYPVGKVKSVLNYKILDLKVEMTSIQAARVNLNAFSVSCTLPIVTGFRS